MPKLNTNWKNSIFGRLLFTFLLIIIPLYFGGLSIYGWGMNIVRQEIVDSMIAQVNNYLNGLERDIRSIEEQSIQTCMFDEDYNRLAVLAETLSNIDRTLSINRLQNRLLAIKSSSEYIENIDAYVLSINRVVLSSGGIAEISPDKYTRLITAKSDSESELIFDDEKLYIIITYPKYKRSISQPRTIAVELSVNNLKKALVLIDSYSNRGTLMISPSTGLEISNGFSSDTTGKIRSILNQKLHKSPSGTFEVEIGNKPYLAIYAKSEYLDMVLCKYIPEDQVFLKIYRYQWVFLIFTAAALIIIVMFTISTKKFIHQPLLKLVKSFKKVEDGNLEIQIEHNHNDEFRYLYQRFNAMVGNLNLLIHQVYKQKILAQRAELKHLQSQINPHFLYNNFFSLHNMVAKGDYENAEQFTQQLGTYFQFITRSGANMVPMENEVAHARIYADIQARRFRNRIRVEFQELPEDLKNVIVPRLIVQPVIENAFEHGLKNTVKNGLIRITFESGPGRFMISVEDNGLDISQDEVARLSGLLKYKHDENEIESTGIINIHRRIQLKYGTGSGMKFSTGDLKGLRVEILIIYDGKGDKTNDAVQDAYS